MATITLTMLRCPPAVAMQERKAQGGELTLGRGADCDWRLLADDEISKKHCKIEYLAGGWQVRDLSSNGTFINYSTTEVGNGQVQQLFDGDRMQLGSYEIEVRIAEEEPYSAGAPAQSRSVPAVPANLAPGFNVSPWQGGSSPLPGLDRPPASAPEIYAPVRNVSGTVEEAFSGLKPGGQARIPIPSDWYRGHIDPGNDLDPTPGLAKESVPVRSRWDQGLESPGTNVVPNVSVSEPVARPPDDSAALASLSSGMNVPLARLLPPATDPQAVMRGAGALLRSAINGIRNLLIARNEVKSEFRIVQTMYRSANNNPLKFAASDDDALAKLLDPRTDSLDAMQEAISDLTLHQIATLAATQAAARALLQRLAPAGLEAEDQGGGLLPGLRERRLWEAYRKLHAQVLAQFDDDFDSAFGKAFARAYEDASNRRRG